MMRVLKLSFTVLLSLSTLSQIYAQLLYPDNVNTRFRSCSDFYFEDGKHSPLNTQTGGISDRAYAFVNGQRVNPENSNFNNYRFREFLEGRGQRHAGEHTYIDGVSFELKFSDLMKEFKANGIYLDRLNSGFDINRPYPEIINENRNNDRTFFIEARLQSPSEENSDLIYQLDISQSSQSSIFLSDGGNCMDMNVAVVFPTDRNASFQFRYLDNTGYSEVLYEASNEPVDGRLPDNAYITPDQDYIYYPWRNITDRYSIVDNPGSTILPQRTGATIIQFVFSLSQEFRDNFSDPAKMPRVFFSFTCANSCEIGSTLTYNCCDDVLVNTTSTPHCPGIFTEVLDLDDSLIDQGFELSSSGEVSILSFEKNETDQNNKKLNVLVDYNPNTPGKESFLMVGNVRHKIIKATSGCTNANICDELSDKCGVLSLEQGEQYRVSFWAKYDVGDLGLSNRGSLEIEFYSDNTTTNSNIASFPIDARLGDQWQLVNGEFEVPSGTCAAQLKFVNNGITPVYFDDVRITPKSSYAESYVYNPSTRELTAKLDENNYATIYEYDTEGNLKRIKKETVNGVVTIQEGRKQISRKLLE